VALSGARYFVHGASRAMNDERRPPLRVEPFLGTDALGRPLTEAEREALAALLRAHDFAGAFLIGLRFALTKTRNRQSARDLMGRVCVRLVRQGWDPNTVTLPKALCRFVYSEWTHTLRETDTARRAEAVFLAMLEASEGRHARSPEDHVMRLLGEREIDANAAAQLDELRVAFLNACDEVNLIWLEMSLSGVTDPGAMAEKSGRDVKEFYRATDRRKRHVNELVAARELAKTKERKE
jgi:hypothetical protein